MLFAAQDWWYESWSASDWFGTFLNQPIEVHTLVLGAFAGILLGSITVRCRPKVAATFAFGMILFALGAVRIESICGGAYRGCRHIRLKPWYFLAGFLLMHILTMGAVEPISRTRSATEQQHLSSVTRLFSLLLLTILGFALYSFVSTEPVQPITGVSTIGGLLGSVLGFSVFYWIRNLRQTGGGFITPAQEIISRDRTELIHVSTFGTVFGFGFPRIVWETGRIFGQQKYAISPDASLQSILFAVGLYAFVIFLLSLLLLMIFYSRPERQILDKDLFIAAVLGNLSYASCLLIAVTLAGIG